MASSSQFGILLIASIGSLLMLMMAPQSGSALECYVRNTTMDLGPVLQLQVGTTAPHPHLLPFGMPTNGNRTEQCRDEDKYCLTIRCPKYSKKMYKYCDVVPKSYTPETLCEQWRTNVCGDKDGKFYCRFCQTDKCNNEPIED